MNCICIKARNEIIRLRNNKNIPMNLKYSLDKKGIGINNSFRYSESIEVIAIIIVTANKNIDKDASLFLPLMLPLSLFDNIIFFKKNIDSKRNKCEINIIFIIILPF
jgi:hypothetical protein